MAFKYKEIDHPKYKYELTRYYRAILNFGPDKRIEGRFHSFHPCGCLRVKVGYRWDGASGPTIDTKSTMRASCVHDVLYQLIREGELSRKYKAAADKELRRLMIEDDPSWGGKIRAGYFYQAVKLFGFWACRRNK